MSWCTSCMSCFSCWFGLGVNPLLNYRNGVIQTIVARYHIQYTTLCACTTLPLPSPLFLSELHDIVIDLGGLCVFGCC